MDDIRAKTQSVMDADARRYAAMKNADIETLDSLLHDQFYYTHFTGLTDRKSAYLDNIRAGKVTYGSAQTSDTTLSIYGTTAVMHGRMQLDCYAADGRHFPLDNLFTAVWVDCDDKWRLAAWASTGAKA